MRGSRSMTAVMDPAWSGGRAASSRSAAVVIALSLIFGVLAMHALTGGPHSIQGSAEAMTMEQASPVLGALDPGGTALDRLQWDSLDGGTAAIIALCVAVLLASAALALRHKRGSALRAGRLISRRHRIHPAGRASRAPPPDLLLRLCVMRT